MKRILVGTPSSLPSLLPPFFHKCNLKGDYILDTDYEVRLRLGPRHLCQGLVEFSLFHFHLTRRITGLAGPQGFRVRT